jgi:hypothetical protein
MRIVTVAPGTGRFGMSANERVISQRMIEPGAVEPHEDEPASFMLGVANLAGLRACAGLAVKALTPLNIGGDAAMAAQALPVLRLARKGLVTGFALCFEPRMGVAKRSRRDQPLDDALRGQ